MTALRLIAGALHDADSAVDAAVAQIDLGAIARRFERGEIGPRPGDMVALRADAAQAAWERNEAIADSDPYLTQGRIW